MARRSGLRLDLLRLRGAGVRWPGLSRRVDVDPERQPQVRLPPPGTVSWDAEVAAAKLLGDPVPIPCRECGGWLWLFVRRSQGALEEWRCVGCGFRWRILSPADDFPAYDHVGYDPDGPVYRLYE
jgi:hypothetical protein